MKYPVSALLLGLISLIALNNANAMPKEHFIIHYVEPDAEAVVSKEEMETWAAVSEEFAATEKRLYEVFKETLASFGPGGESWLEMNQGDWSKRRQVDAFEQHSPKGSPAYIRFLTEEADKRVQWLEQLGKKGKVVFTHNYLYQQPGHEGMVILYYRDRGLEFELYTKNLKTGAVCEAFGEGIPHEGKTRYQDLSIEFVDLGKALQVTAFSEAELCQEGGHLTGEYILTK